MIDEASLEPNIVNAWKYTLLYHSITFRIGYSQLHATQRMEHEIFFLTQARVSSWDMKEGC